MTSFDLGKAESDASRQIHLLENELKNLEAARRDIAQRESQTTYAAGAGYGIRSGYGSQDSSYGTAASAGQDGQLQRARDAEAGASARVAEIAGALRTLAGQTQGFKRDAQSNAGSLARFGGNLHGREERAQYRGGEAVASGYVQRCDRILSAIENALQGASGLLSSGSGKDGKHSRASLDAIVDNAAGAARGRARENYLTNTIQSATIYHVDVDRYGPSDELGEPPVPEFGNSENTRSGSLSDKVSFGGAYTHWPAASPYTVTLPDVRYRMRRRGYAQPDLLGRYMVLDQ